MENGALITIGNKLLVGWGRRTLSATPSEGSFYFPDFALQDPTPWFSYENTEVLSISDFLKLLKKEECRIVWKNHCKALFEREFHKLHELLQAGLLQKAVPYVFAEGEGKLSIAWCLTNVLAYAQKFPVFVYGFWEGNSGILGATPELLFSQEEGRVETAAVAGTAKCSASLNDRKTDEEHQVVIDGIAEALSPFGAVAIGGTEELILSDLKHLKTALTLHAEPPFSRLVEALHPTPALGGYPRLQSQRWLCDYQTLLPRQRFGAPVGYWKGGRGGCYVAIRNVQWEGDKLRIGAGCGVVKESEWSKEWKELELKISATRRILAI